MKAETTNDNVSPSRGLGGFPEAGPGGSTEGIGNRQLTIGNRPWLVVKTKIKCEKFVRDRIIAMGMEAFVPLRKRTARYNRKVKTYEHPLISCYTFIRFDPDRRNDVLALPYVQGMLRTKSRDCTVSEKEMTWLQKISGTDLDVKTETLSMLPGEKVVLAYGQLAGMEGTIVSHHSKHEVAVALESLGLQMLIRIDVNMLEKIYN